MQTMAEREGQKKLSGRVVADDTYLGSVTAGGKRGRGAKKAGLFMTAVEVDEKSSVRYVRFDRLQNMTAESIQSWAKKALHGDCHLVTDGYSSLPAAAPVIATHTPVVVIVSPGKSSRLDCFRWVNTLISNTKTAITGTYHGFKISKYAHSYLAEAQYRFNRRFNLERLVTRLLYACVQNDPRGSKWIRAAESAC